MTIRDSYGTVRIPHSGSGVKADLSSFLRGRVASGDVDWARLGARAGEIGGSGKGGAGAAGGADG